MEIVKSQKGVTLAEILIATTIIVFATVAIIQFYLSSFGLSEINKDEVIAQTHLINMMEAIKCTPFSNMLIDFPDGVLDGVNNSYAAVVGNYTLAGEHIIVSYINVNSDPLETMVNVSWQNRGQTRASYLVTKKTR